MNTAASAISTANCETLPTDSIRMPLIIQQTAHNRKQMLAARSFLMQKNTYSG